MRETLQLIASPLLAALATLDPDSPERSHVETSLRACRKLIGELGRDPRARPASIALDARAFRVTGYQPRRRVSDDGDRARVLVVEDAAEQRAFLAACIAPYADVVEVGSAQEALAMLRERPFEVVITDLVMPEMRGDELCVAIRAEPQLQHLRLIVLTSIASRTLRDDLLAEVVDDYLTKPIDPSELELRLRRLGRAARNARRLFDAARTDQLTKLPNRRALMEALEQAAYSSAMGRSAALALVDVDHFKHVNDRYGHAVGDEVLVALSERLLGALGPHDLVGRFGGEEFLVVIEDATRAESVSEAARAAVATSPFLTSAGPLPVSISVGVARFGDDDPTWATVVERADARLYQAKADGRDRVVGSGACPAFDAFTSGMVPD